MSLEIKVLIRCDRCRKAGLVIQANDSMPSVEIKDNWTHVDSEDCEGERKDYCPECSKREIEGDYLLDKYFRGMGVTAPSRILSVPGVRDALLAAREEAS